MLYFFVCSRLRSSSIIALFFFSPSLNVFNSVSDISLPIDLMRMNKSVSLLNVICVLFISCSPLRLSFVSVVFDFNASLNDVAPVSPM